jgi:hypothetical protein
MAKVPPSLCFSLAPTSTVKLIELEEQKVAILQKTQDSEKKT